MKLGLAWRALKRDLKGHVAYLGSFYKGQKRGQGPGVPPFIGRGGAGERCPRTQGSRARGEARTSREALVWDSVPPPPPSHTRKWRGLTPQGRTARLGEPSWEAALLSKGSLVPLLLVPEVLPSPAFPRLKCLASPLGIHV